MGLNNIQCLGPDAGRLLISYGSERTDLSGVVQNRLLQTTAIFLHPFTLNHGLWQICLVFYSTQNSLETVFPYTVTLDRQIELYQTRSYHKK